jgi:hypothetical protein
MVVLMGHLLKPSLLKTPVILSVWFPSWTVLQNWTLADWLLLILALGYICFGAGIAWGRASNQAMRVADDLEPDEEHNTIRLLVVNRGRKSIQPVATIMWIESEDGQDHGAITPVECDWMHGRNVAASQGAIVKVDVASFSKNEIYHEIHFGNRGAAFYRGIKLRSQTGEGVSVSFCVRVEIPDTTAFQERAFRLEPSQNYPFGLRVIRLRHRERSHG